MPPQHCACANAAFAGSFPASITQLAASYLATSAYIARPNDWKHVRRNVETKVLEAWSNDLRVWPIANFISFSFIPLHLRPAYASCVQLIWQVRAVAARSQCAHTLFAASASTCRLNEMSPVPPHNMHCSHRS